MNRLWLVLVLTFALSSASCRRECDCNVLSDSDYSGFGYAASFCHNGAEALFVIESASECSATAVIRCKATSEHDLTACSMSIGNQHIPLVIPEAGKWVDLSVNIKLNRGRNDLGIVGAESIQEDILIDYLEIK